MIARSDYINYLNKFKDMPLIKVIWGVRRCGKSTLFLQYIEYLKSNDIDDDHIIFINFEDLEYEEYTDYKTLYNYLNKRIIDSKKYYIFLDEIQNVEKYEKTVDSLLVKGNCDIYITGSNTYMLSSELSTLLSGRYIEIKMFPLSFKEYVSYYKDVNNDYEDLFNKYISSSSYPFSINFKEENMLNKYLEDIYNSIIIKDISLRIKKLDISLLHRIVKFMFDSIGSILSINNIANKLSSDGYKIDNKTVSKYIEVLIESMLFYKVERYDVKGKNILSSLEKYYVVDIGIRRIKLGRNYSDLGHIIENIVYLELMRRNYNVYIGYFTNAEIDFVAIKNGEIEYYQVCLSLLNEEVLKREVKSLKMINDNYPKYIISMDKVGTNYNIDGIKHINLVDWLLDRYWIIMLLTKAAWFINVIVIIISHIVQ